MPPIRPSGGDAQKALEFSPQKDSKSEKCKPCMVRPR